MSERDWKQTPTLDEFNAMYDEDDNIWWRIACGHHQNLYEAAVERYQTAEAQIQRVRGIVDADQTVPIDARDPASYVAGYADATFRVRQVLDGQR